MRERFNFDLDPILTNINLIRHVSFYYIRYRNHNLFKYFLTIKCISQFPLYIISTYHSNPKLNPIRRLPNHDFTPFQHPVDFLLRCQHIQAIPEIILRLPFLINQINHIVSVAPSLFRFQFFRITSQFSHMQHLSVPKEPPTRSVTQAPEHFPHQFPEPYIIAPAEPDRKSH